MQMFELMANLDIINLHYQPRASLQHLRASSPGRRYCYKITHHLKSQLVSEGSKGLERHLQYTVSTQKG